MTDEPIAHVELSEDQHGLVAAGGRCAPSELAYGLLNDQSPCWFYDLTELARKFEKRARKLEKKERKLMPVYRSTAKIETLRANAAELRTLAARLAEEANRAAIRAYIAPEAS